MKKSILIILSSFFIAITVNAQISKGSVFLGGSLLFTHNSSDSRTGFSIGTEIGKAYKENSIAGIYLQYINPGASNGSTYNNYGGGLFLRKYRQLGKNFYFFGDGQLNYFFFKSISSPNPNEVQTTKQSTYSLSIYPGISYSLTRKFHIDVTIDNLLFINYNTTKTNYSSPGNSLDTKTSAFSVSANNHSNLPFTLGFNFIL